MSRGKNKRKAAMLKKRVRRYMTALMRDARTLLLKDLGLGKLV